MIGRFAGTGVAIAGTLAPVAIGTGVASAAASTPAMLVQIAALAIVCALADVVLATLSGRLRGSEDGL